VLANPPGDTADRIGPGIVSGATGLCWQRRNRCHRQRSHQSGPAGDAAGAGREDGNVTNILNLAIARAGYTNALAAQLTRDALLRNLDIAEKLGCLDDAGLGDLRRGQSPTIREGPYQGQELSVDHIIPRAVCPELDNVIANLELMPMKLNSAKGARVGQRQRDLADKFHTAGLLATSRLETVLRR
jgi:hypothetical protein